MLRLSISWFEPVDETLVLMNQRETKAQASLRSLTRAFAARTYKIWRLIVAENKYLTNLAPLDICACTFKGVNS